MEVRCLGIDQARVSGWSIVSFDGARLRVLASGVATSPKDRAEAVRDAIAFEVDAVLLEDHAVVERFRRKRNERGEAETVRANTPATLIGMGTAKGRWLEQLELAECPKARVHKVTSSDWRERIFGSFARTMSTERAKSTAKTWASGTAGRPITDDNEAEAVCIAAYGAREIAWAKALERAQAKGR